MVEALARVGEVVKHVVLRQAAGYNYDEIALALQRDQPELRHVPLPPRRKGYTKWVSARARELHAEIDQSERRHTEAAPALPEPAAAAGVDVVRRCCPPSQVGTQVGTTRPNPTSLTHLTYGFKPFPLNHAVQNGRCRTRTCGHLRVRQALYQLS